MSLDERVVVASIVDQQQRVLCRVINTYVAAQASARPDFLRSFLDLPFVHEVDSGPWMLLGDFNMSLHSRSVAHNSSVAPWYDWIKLHFNDCFPDGTPTFTRGDSRTTIDYIFGHTSLASRLTNGATHFLPTAWTDHCLLSVDLLPARQDFGRGCWRFNPTLLMDEGFTALLDKTVSQFFEGNVFQDGSGEPLAPQEQWESCKFLLKCTAQQYTRGSKARFKNKLARLQQQRVAALSLPETGAISRSGSMSDQPSSGFTLGDSSKVKELEQLIDKQTQIETQQCMLRSATR